MPWKVTEPMCERAKFVALHDEGLFSMSELCQRLGVSRRTGYKWLARFEQDGLDGLRGQSRKPHSSPKQTCLEVQEALRCKRAGTIPPGDPRNSWPISSPAVPTYRCPQRPAPWANCSNSKGFASRASVRPAPGSIRASQPCKPTFPTKPGALISRASFPQRVSHKGRTRLLPTHDQ